MSNKGHNWNGFPGGMCIKCGSECAIENALALNWYSIWPLEPDETGQDGKDFGEEWKSDIHKKYVELCDSECPADMETVEEKEAYWNKVFDAEEKVKEIDPEFAENYDPENESDK